MIQVHSTYSSIDVVGGVDEPNFAAVESSCSAEMADESSANKQLDADIRMVGCRGSAETYYVNFNA